MSSHSRARAAAAVALVALAGRFVALACSSPPSDSRYVLTSAPDRATFPPIADLMDRRCGTLDCHGTTGRNFRIYGSSGLRLGVDARPSSQLNTTAAEYDESYLSLVGLEPEVMGQVIADHGAQPERLTFVRKARGQENHKGGTLWQPGDDQDVCITSWLAGQTDTASCTRGYEAGF